MAAVITAALIGAGGSLLTGLGSSLLSPSAPKSVGQGGAQAAPAGQLANLTPQFQGRDLSSLYRMLAEQQQAVAQGARRPARQVASRMTPPDGVA